MPRKRARLLPPCHNSLTTALLMDTYQITMAYAYWKNGTHARPAAFDLLFRKNPFNGEFTVFAGLEECLRFVSNFRFTPADIAYVKNEPIAHSMDPRFFDYLARLDCSEMRKPKIRGTLMQLQSVCKGWRDAVCGLRQGPHAQRAAAVTASQRVVHNLQTELAVNQPSLAVDVARLEWWR